MWKNLLQPGWLDYNHLYIFGKSLHQQEYKILKKGFEGGLSKQQISNVFNNQDMLQSPLIAIEKYSGVILILTVIIIVKCYTFTKY